MCETSCVTGCGSCEVRTPGAPSHSSQAALNTVNMPALPGWFYNVTLPEALPTIIQPL